jgi:FkbM family methyltransferase
MPSQATMQSKFVNYHIGSRNVQVGFPILPVFARDIINVLFDADSDSIDQTLQLWSQHSECETKVFPYCISGDERCETLHINFDAYTSSILPFNTEYAAFYTVSNADRVDYVLEESCRTMERRKVKAVSLDALLDLDIFRGSPPDFLSLDTQGSEYRILSGASAALRHNILGLMVEVEFVQLYEGQELFHHIQSLLEHAGFRLTRIITNEEFSPFRGPIGARGRGFVLAGEALFLRRLETLKDLKSDDERYAYLHKLAFISIMFECLEYASQVLNEADRLTPSQSLMQELGQRRYFKFLREMVTAIAGLPPEYLLTMEEAMTFRDAQARFKARGSPIGSGDGAS